MHTLVYTLVYCEPQLHTTAAMLSGLKHSDLDDLLLLNTVPHSLGVSNTHDTVTV
jgi:hypothetical protein